MPTHIVGRSKRGRELELRTPAVLFDRTGRPAWSEWEVKRGEASLKASRLFGPTGAKLSQTNSGVILGKDGRALNAPNVSGVVSSKELELLLANEKLQHANAMWLPERLKFAWRTLKKVEELGKGNQPQALKLLLLNPFFREALVKGKLKIPEKKVVTIEDIKYAAEGLFFEESGKFYSSKAREFVKSDKQVRKHTRRIVPASK